MLKETAQVIRLSVRKSDIVIRYGGEEFLVVLLDQTPGEALKVAEKIRVQVERLEIKLLDGVLHKTMSLGVSEFPADGGTVWECINCADAALLRAKEEGHNRCVRFMSDMWREEQAYKEPSKGVAPERSRRLFWV